MSAMKPVICAAVLAITVAGPARAAESAITIDGGSRAAVSYACDNGRSFRVVYVNAPPDALALVPIDGKRRIFVNVISGSGARYAAGIFIWWTKGNEAWLYDLTHGGEASPVATCHATHR